MIGNGISSAGPGCVNRSVDQSAVIEGWIQFENSIIGASGSVLADTESSIIEALDAYLGCSCRETRFMATRIVPYDATSFRLEFIISPPLTPEEPTAQELFNEFMLLSPATKLNVPDRGDLISSVVWARIISDALTTTTTVTTVTETTVTSTTVSTQTVTSQTATSVTSTVLTTVSTISSSSTPGLDSRFDQAGGDRDSDGGFGSGWNRTDTIHLLVALLVTVIVMLAIFQVIYLRRKRQNFLVEQSIANSATQDTAGGWWQTREPTEGNELSRHYYPASNAWAS